MKKRSLREANNPNYDSRSDLGYVTTRSQELAKLQKSWPYVEDPRYDIDDEEQIESEKDLETAVAIGNKSGGGHVAWDSYADRARDNRRFVGVDSKITSEDVGVGRGLVPIPDLYANKDGVLGAGADGPLLRPGPAKISLAGSKAGWSSATPLGGPGTNAPVMRLADIPTPDQMTMIRLKRLIRAIHAQEKFARK